MAIIPSAHVRIANVAGDLVLLDLERDEYLALSNRDAEAIFAALNGSKYDPTDPILLELLEGGFVVLSPTPSELTRPRPSLPLPDPIPPGLASRIWMMLLFGLAVPMTLLSYYRSPRGLTGQTPVLASRDKYSPQRIAGIVQWFERVRIFVPRSGRCLIQSLLLLHFLRLLCIRPEIVFGVRTHPFEAHCWVEWNSLVLNDSVDHVSWYTTIARF